MRARIKSKVKGTLKRFSSKSRDSSPSPAQQAPSVLQDDHARMTKLAEGTYSLSSQPTSSVPRGRRNNWNRSKALLKDSVELAKEAGDTFPGASLIFGGLIKIFDALDKIDANSTNAAELQNQIHSFVVIFKKATIPGNPPELITDAKEAMLLLDHALKASKEIESQEWWERFADRDVNEDDLKSLLGSIKLAVDRFNLNSTIRLQQQLHLSELSRLLNTLPRADKASHRSSQSDARSSCFQNTRVKVLQDINEWIDDPEPSAPPIFWINGMAGIGKSTIAQTVAEKAYAQGILGASFFFSRQNDKRRDPSLVVPTIAHQLAFSSLTFKLLIGAAIENDPLVLEASIQNQIKTLIIDPLAGVDRDRPVVVLVLDALDECEAKGATELLQLLVAATKQIPFRFRILVTSRPEPHIKTVLDNETAKKSIVLHMIEDTVVGSDIKLYVGLRLRKIAGKLNVSTPEGWPHDDDVEALVSKAGKLFIFAVTCISFIDNDRVSDPAERLEILLKSGPSSANAYANLDNLYGQVLLYALRDPVESNSRNAIDDTVLKRYKRIIGTIVLLRNPLTVNVLASFVDYGENVVRIALLFLQSIIVVPSNAVESLSIYHPSFRDYITDPTRCEDSNLRVDVMEHETWLTIRCLDLLMTKLSRDMAGIRTPSLMNNEVEGLRDRVEKAIPPEVRYACLYWASHLCELQSRDDAVMKLLSKFLSKSMLWWFEALSLLGNVATAVIELQKAHQWAIDKGCDAEIIGLLYDGYRFILAHSDVIRDAALHVYYSALPFVPRQTRLWNTYESEARRSTSVVLGVDEAWSSCLRILNDHSDRVQSVAFSPDGQRLASGSSDHTVRLWDVVTGTAIATLQGHSDVVWSVAFSPDGRRLASGSSDHMVRLWDVVTGTATATLQGHFGSVYSVAFSPDGQRLASGSSDDTVRLWDVATGTATATLRGHDDAVQSVTFSRDGQRLASGSSDRTVRLWDVATGTATATLQGHSDMVWSVAFSPDGQCLASGSSDHTVRLWDVVTGTATGTLQGHSGPVLSVVFTPDGQCLASGSWDHTVRLWDVVTGTATATLQGHSDAVYSVAFSPDGQRLASGSYDHTVRLWDVVTGTATATLQGHSDAVQSVAFSPDGQRLASGSYDHTVRLWDVVTGTATATLQIHSGPVSSLAFSANGDQITCRSYHGGFLAWDISSGEVVQLADSESTLPSDPSPVFCIEDRWLSYRLPSDTWSRICRIDGFNIRYDTFQEFGFRAAVGCHGGEVLLFDSERILASMYAISSLLS